MNMIGVIPIVVGILGLMINGYQIIMINKHKNNPESYWFGMSTIYFYAMGMPYSVLAITFGCVALIMGNV